MPEQPPLPLRDEIQVNATRQQPADMSTQPTSSFTSHPTTMDRATRLLFLLLLLLCWANAQGPPESGKLKETAKPTTLKKASLQEKKSADKAWLGASPAAAKMVRAGPDAALPNVTLSYDDEFDEKNITDTVQQNDRMAIKVNYSYFEATFVPDARQLWIDLKTFNESHFRHDVLSNSHRRAASISLPFPFPFYGNNLTRTTVATGGFLYMGEHVHSWLAATQYVAPLMANFDTRNSSRAQILYGYNATVFVVQWDHVMLQERPELEFTFQCALRPNGDIMFVYKDIPIPIEQIPDSDHPVKVGVSDAYFLDKQQLFARRKTIYEYHKIDVKKHDGFPISSNTAIILKALPSCNSFDSCQSCLSANISFNCVWCPAVKRCSDGYDRQRQEWIYNRCEQSNGLHDLAKCFGAAEPNGGSSTPAAPAGSSTVVAPTANHSGSSQPPVRQNGSASTAPRVIPDHSDKNIDIHDDKNLTNLEYNTQQEHRTASVTGSKRGAASSGAHSSLVITLVFLLSLVLGMSFWVMYAYRYPTSASGQFLIRWRPSAWRWKGVETRYTAASIHM